MPLAHRVPHTVGVSDCIEKAEAAVRHHKTIMRCTKRRDPQAYMNARRNLHIAENNLRAWQQVNSGEVAA